ncbi:MAG: GTP cyclohydrolase II [Candidatus Latescibacteria bacterium]|nr:GTP cyclohydrolase II [Candidatus Latescibacterota bacterium]
MPDFNSIEEIAADLRQGAMVVLVDEHATDIDGSQTVGEGELMVLGEKATAAAVNFMMREARGTPAATASKGRLEHLDLAMMIPGTTGPRGAAFMAGINAAAVGGTGVSAQDRALTVCTLAAATSTAADFVQPGHINLMQAQPGGVLRRAGHTEASVDLALQAGCQPVTLMTTILDDEGGLASTPYLLDFAARHGLKIATIKDLIAHRSRTEKLVALEAHSTIPTRYGEFDFYAYRSLVDDKPYIALVKGEVGDGEDTLVRMHSGCLTGDVLGSYLCDCGDQLQRSLAMIAEAGRGVLVYIQHHEGRGIGIIQKLKAYELQRDKGMDTIEANHALGHPMDSRDYGVGAQVLYDLGLRRVRFLSNNPKKRVGLEAYGLTVVEQVPIEAAPNPHNIEYLITKRDRMGHTTLLHESVETAPSSPDTEDHAENTRR